MQKVPGGGGGACPHPPTAAGGGGAGAALPNMAGEGTPYIATSSWTACHCAWGDTKDALDS